jgi:hypothetical protein
MDLEVFNYRDRCVLDGVLGSGRFQHSAGGTAQDTWLRNSDLEAPFDLLFTLDLSDPSIDIKIPGVTRLPLLYGMNYLADADQSYHVINDDTVQVRDARPLKPNRDGDYGVDGTQRPIELVDRNLDLAKAEDALSMLQTFGLNDLDDAELARAIEIAYSGNYALEVIEDWIVYKDSTRREYLEFWGSPPFWQPSGFSSKCERSHCSGSSVRVIACCPFGELLVIFRYCEVCHWIFTTNQTG